MQVVCGVEDDFKGAFSAGKCVYLNQPIDRWLKRLKLKPADIWPGIPEQSRTLWTAQLFAAAPTRDMAHLALPLATSKPTAAAISHWRKTPRFSMAMILEQADPAALIAHREVVSAALQSEQLISSIRRGEDQPLDTCIGRYITDEAYTEAERLLSETGTPTADGDATAALAQARALWSAAQLLQRPDHPAPASARPRIETYMQRAFAKVAEASEIGHRRIEVLRQRQIQTHRGTRNRRHRPRPHRPGRRLDRHAPLLLRTRRTCRQRRHQPRRPPPRPRDRPHHRRTASHPRKPRPGPPHRNRPRHRCRIHQRLRPLRPPSRRAVPHRTSPPKNIDLKRHLRSIGAGVHIATESRVPKGSGLGTSSILAAALLAALHRFRGRTPSTPRSSNKPSSSNSVSAPEAAGRTRSAASSVESNPPSPPPASRSAPPSNNSISPTPRSKPSSIDCRLLLRPAALRPRHPPPRHGPLARPRARDAIAHRIAEADRRRPSHRPASKLRWHDAAENVARYWQIKKELYPGSTTPSTDLLLLEMRDDYLAAGLAGAGGGGFAYFLCRDANQSARLRDRLAEHSTRPGFPGSVYTTQINRDGLLVKTARTR